MSRNKFIILVTLVVMAYFVTPKEGVWLAIKMNLVNALPYILALIIIYLVITINMLKRRWKKLDAELNDENTINFAKMMNITFDVKRMLGVSNLIDLYSKVNFSKSVSLHAKELLYQAMRRKRLDVPVPGSGVDVDEILRKSKSKEEVRAAQIEAKMRAKQKARGKKKHS